MLDKKLFDEISRVALTTYMKNANVPLGVILPIGSKLNKLKKKYSNKNIRCFEDRSRFRPTRAQSNKSVIMSDQVLR
jgi:hypothetical protein